MPSAALAILTALLSSAIAFSASARDKQTEALFDKPVQVKRVVLGPSPAAKDEKKELRCATFPHFMVKEIDAKEVGDEQISIIPLTSPTDRPLCQAKNLPTERVIPADKWSGYFLGAKSDFVFFSADDGVNGGLGFAVFRGADATSVFQDSVKLDGDHTKFQSIATDGNGLKLRYTRVYSGQCSVPTDGPDCWTKIATEAHLPTTPAPDCAAGYLRAKQELAKARCDITHRKDAACIKQEMQRMQEDDKSPSVIGYDVEVVLQPPQQTVTPLGSALACWPAD